MRGDEGPYCNLPPSLLLGLAEVSWMSGSNGVLQLQEEVASLRAWLMATFILVIVWVLHGTQDAVNI